MIIVRLDLLNQAMMDKYWCQWDNFPKLKKKLVTHVDYPFWRCQWHLCISKDGYLPYLKIDDPDEYREGIRKTLNKHFCPDVAKEIYNFLQPIFVKWVWDVDYPLEEDYDSITKHRQKMELFYEQITTEVRIDYTIVSTRNICAFCRTIPTRWIYIEDERGPQFERFKYSKEIQLLKTTQKKGVYVKGIIGLQDLREICCWRDNIRYLDECKLYDIEGLHVFTFCF